MAFVVKRSTGAGGADATWSSISDAFTAISDTLVAAGWTIHDTISSSSVVFKSTGESGQEVIFLHFLWSGTNLGWRLYQYWDTTGHAGYNTLGRDTADFRIAVGAFTWNYVMVADKNSIAVGAVSSSPTYVRIWAGNFTRFPDTNANNMVLATSATAGSNVTLDVSPSSPAALNYKVGDVVCVASQQTTGPEAGAIPLFYTTVTAIGATSITVATVPENVSSGALIGEDPQPFGCLDPIVSGAITGSDLRTVTSYTSMALSNVYTAIGTAGTTRLDGVVNDLRGALVTVASSEADPDVRTNRMLLDTLELYGTGVWRRGYLDKIYLLPRTTDARWDVAVLKNTKHYVIWTSATAGNRFAIGPVN